MPEIHYGLAGYMRRMNLEALDSRADDAIVLVVGQRFRVFCRPAPFGDLVLECRITDLPTSRIEADNMIRDCLLGSWSRMHEFSDVPVLSKDSSTLLLQQRLIADTTVDEFESALEAYVNSLSEWRRIFRVL